MHPVFSNIVHRAIYQITFCFYILLYITYFINHADLSMLWNLRYAWLLVFYMIGRKHVFCCLKRKHMTIFHESIVVSTCNIYAAKVDWSSVVVYLPQVPGQHNELYHLRSATALLYKVGWMLIWPPREIQILRTMWSSHYRTETLSHIFLILCRSAAEVWFRSA